MISPGNITTMKKKKKKKKEKKEQDKIKEIYEEKVNHFRDVTELIFINIKRSSFSTTVFFQERK